MKPFRFKDYPCGYKEAEKSMNHVIFADELFSRKVRYTSGCWEWTGSTCRFGYGEVRRENRLRAAHRYAWELTRGSIPKGLFVLHKCDNPRCVRPSHLFLGTQKDNVRDCINKGRAKRGIPKLNKNYVSEIRMEYSNGTPQSKLAGRYHVHQSLISLIVNRRIWK